jgi:hypothetical protein
MFTCNKSDSEPIETKVYRTDSIYVYITDTIEREIHVPYAVVPLTSIDEEVDTNYLGQTLSTYYYTKQDSLLTSSIAVTSTCYPEDVKLEYDLKQFTIHDTVSTYIRDSVYQEGTPKSFLSAGATILGGKESFGFAPQLMYSHKKGNNYSLGYDLINGNVMVGFSKKISFK